MFSPSDRLPYITFIIHDIEGGVASMNHQIIEHADLRKQFNVRVILWRTLEETDKSFRGTFRNVNEIRTIRYSIFDSYFRTIKGFSDLLNQRPGIFVTNDGIELDAIRKFGTSSVLFSIVHDFYNLKLAIESLDLVDYFICHTDVFTRALRSAAALQERVKYLLHGVRVIGKDTGTHNNPGRTLRIVSISRLTARKGVLLFSQIEERLVARSVQVEWVIIGSGELEEQLKETWKHKTNISFYQPDEQEQVFEIARSCDIFISPSLYEGYGIALLEAMSCGLVPVIHKLPIGVYSDLPEDVGFSVDSMDPGDFADHIVRLDRDRQLLSDMSANAGNLVVRQYDIRRTADGFLECFRQNNTARINKDARPRQTVRLGFLDRPYIPGFVTRIIRKKRLS